MFLSHYKYTWFLEAFLFFCGTEDQTQGIVHAMIHHQTAIYVILNKSQR